MKLMGKAIRFCGGEGAENAVQVYAKVLADKKATDKMKIAVLDSLLDATSGKLSSKGWFNDAFKELPAILPLASTKPQQRFLCILAFRVIIAMLTHMPELEANLK